MKLPSIIEAEGGSQLDLNLLEWRFLEYELEGVCIVNLDYEPDPTPNAPVYVGAGIQDSAF